MKIVHIITFIAIIPVLICCKNEPSKTADPSFVLQDRQISWLQSGHRYTVNNASASLIIKPNGQVLNMTAKNQEIGVVLQVYDEKGNFGNQVLSQDFVQTGEYNSLKVYVTVEQYLSIFISERCRPAEGSIVIDNLDFNNHTVSGRFSGKVCKGSTERLKDNFHIVTEGQFKNLPMSVVEQ